MCRAAVDLCQGWSDCQTMYCVRLLYSFNKSPPNTNAIFKDKRTKNLEKPKIVKPMWALVQVKPNYKKHFPSPKGLPSGGPLR